jgi:hypothetical protein
LIDKLIPSLVLSKDEEVVGGWTVYNGFIRLKEHIILCMITKGEEDEVREACSTNGEKLNACRLLVGKLEGKRPLGGPRLRWVDNIMMDLGEVGWGDVGWIDLAQDRDRLRDLMYEVMNLRVP